MIKVSQIRALNEALTTLLLKFLQVGYNIWVLHVSNVKKAFDNAMPSFDYYTDISRDGGISRN